MTSCKFPVTHSWPHLLEGDDYKKTEKPDSGTSLRGTEGVTSLALVSAKVFPLSHLRLWKLSFVCSLTVFSLGTFWKAMGMLSFLPSLFLIWCVSWDHRLREEFSF